jgi:hypothetical protein
MREQWHLPTSLVYRIPGHLKGFVLAGGFFEISEHLELIVEDRLILVSVKGYSLVSTGAPLIDCGVNLLP